jgi:hypothetical protein
VHGLAPSAPDSLLTHPTPQAQGNIEGLVITGLNPDTGFQLLQKYLDLRCPLVPRWPSLTASASSSLAQERRPNSGLDGRSLPNPPRPSSSGPRLWSRPLCLSS